MTIEAGKTYRNATNERRRVDRVEDGTVHFTYPASLKDGQQPLPDFEAWAVGEYVDPFAWKGGEFDLIAYCTAFPAGLAVVAGGTAAAIAIKDRNVASSKVIEATGSKPATPPAPAPEPQPELGQVARRVVLTPCPSLTPSVHSESGARFALEDRKTRG